MGLIIGGIVDGCEGMMEVVDKELVPKKAMVLYVTSEMVVIEAEE